MAILLGIFSLDYSPLGAPEGIFLKMYSGPDSVPKAFEVSGLNLQEQDAAFPMHLVFNLKESW